MKTIEIDDEFYMMAVLLSELSKDTEIDNVKDLVEFGIYTLFQSVGTGVKILPNKLDDKVTLTCKPWGSDT